MFAALAIAAVFQISAQQDAPEVRHVVVEADEHARARGLLRRVGVVGASAASGFGSGLTTARVIGGALQVRERVIDVSTARHFTDPLGIGEAQIKRMRRRDPTVVFAADFLFWFVAGDKPLPDRRRDLAKALALLDTLDCPVFVGDIPDLEGADERMIAPWQIVPEEERMVLNVAIWNWASERPDTVVVPLGAWYDAARHGGVVTIGEVDYEVGPDDEILRKDRIHPTRVGQVMLGLLLVQEFDHAFPGLDAEELRLDPERLWRRHAPTKRRPAVVVPEG